MNEIERDQRYTLIRICGCVACHLFKVPGVVPPQVHHLNAGDKHGGERLGDEFTVGLCVCTTSGSRTKGCGRASAGP